MAHTLVLRTCSVMERVASQRGWTGWLGKDAAVVWKDAGRSSENAGYICKGF